MERRDFIRVCTASALGLGTHQALAASNAKPRLYARALLIDGNGRPLQAAQLAVGENYVFNYPYAGTPCFLLNLGKSTVQGVSLKTEKGAAYHWPGGVGPRRAIVGYSAICSHKLTYPTRQISFISYRDQSTASKISKPRMIHCCSEHSEYDPAAGARVMGGPAPQPLCAILLEHDPASDRLYATGTLGGELFNNFFSKYELRLTLEHGSPTQAQQHVAEKTTVTALAEFCKQQVRC